MDKLQIYPSKLYMEYKNTDSQIAIYMLINQGKHPTFIKFFLVHQYLEQDWIILQLTEYQMQEMELETWEILLAYISESNFVECLI